MMIIITIKIKEKIKKLKAKKMNNQIIKTL